MAILNHPERVLPAAAPFGGPKLPPSRGVAAKTWNLKSKVRGGGFQAVTPPTPEVDLLQPVAGGFLADVWQGLSANPKTLPCKYFYDARGSDLFEQICDLPEYYPTRTEAAILSERLEEIGAQLPFGTVLVEYGSGSSTKTRLLLDNLESVSTYVPVEISSSALLRSTWRLRAAYPRLTVRPVRADFTQNVKLPRLDGRPRVIFFPGSTIGNFGPSDATALLRRMAGVAGPGGGLLVGVDLRKSPETLVPAYDDAAGVTAAFNKNLLVRINRELGAEIDPDTFTHRAVWNDSASRIEMHLESSCDQTIEIGGRRFEFAAGETIHTENSHKYSRDAFAELATKAGWTVQRVWTDDQELFSVQYLTVG